ncbi:hypothetical protein EV361DRAFT_961107 [Lentinula raphanica]|nr:hypothetical protein EV361DRAFT_961107 [Lentinula raphanica]
MRTMSSPKLKLADYSSFTPLLQNGGDFESPAQRKELQDIIEKSIKQDIPAIELDIQQSLMKIHKLESKKKRVQSSVSRFKELLTPVPINRLPTEILVEIFLIFRDSTSDRDSTAITQGVWPLTHVSRRWRSITVSLPQLWIYINIDDIHKPAKNQLRILNTALARSGSHALHIDAYLPGFIHKESEFDSRHLGPQATNSIPLWPSRKELISAMIRAVVQHSDRWVTANIHLAFADCLRPIYRRLSSLEKLTVGGELYGDPLIFSVAPKLRDLEILNADTSTLRFPWKQLVRFHDSQYDPYNDPLPLHLRILRKYPQLEEFEDDSDGDHEKTSKQSITHHNLTALMCSDYRLVRCLTLPSLRSLHLHSFASTCPPEIIPAAHDLLNRSQCASSLRVLHLESVELDRSVFNLIESTNGLADFIFSFGEWNSSNDASMECLINRMSTCRKEIGKQVLLPRLESFTVNVRLTFRHDSDGCACNIEFLDKKYVDMVEARWNNSGSSVSQLRVVKFESDIPATLSALTDRCIQRMKKMRDEGLITYIAASTSEDSKETRIYVKH